MTDRRLLPLAVAFISACSPAATSLLPGVDARTDVSDGPIATEIIDAGLVDAPTSDDIPAVDVPAPIDVQGVDTPPPVDIPVADASTDAPVNPDLPVVVDARPTVCTPDAATCPSATERSVCNADGTSAATSPCPVPVNATVPRCTGAGVCGFECALGFGNCDGAGGNGCEANLRTDSSHCGACDVNCSAGRCADSISISTSTLAAWSFNGSAAWDGSTSSLVLTPAAANFVVGSAFSRSAVMMDRFAVAFEFRITPGGAGADGLAFVMQRTGVTALGGEGGGLGAVGTDGFAVEFDVHQNIGCGDSAGNQIAVSSLVGCAGAKGRLPTQLRGSTSISPRLDNGAWRQAAIDYDRGAVTIRVDGAVAIDRYDVPGASDAVPYWLGFASGTGAGTARSEVRNVSITFRAPRCL